MSEIIDGYTAKLIKDFWMNPQSSSYHEHVLCKEYAKELESKLSEAKKIADNYSVIAEKAVLVTKELELRFQAARNCFVRSINIDEVPFHLAGKIHEIKEKTCDQEISAELLRLQEVERQSRLKQEKK